MSRVVVLITAALAVGLGGCKTVPYDARNILADCTYQVLREGQTYYVVLDRNMELNHGNYWADIKVQVAFSGGGIDNDLHVLVPPGIDKKPISDDRVINSVAMQACHVYNPRE